MTKANLYHELLKYAPRDGRSAKENFLTEVFAHTLRTTPAAGAAWLREALGLPFEGPLNVETQVAFPASDGRTAIIDMVVHARLADGHEQVVLCEHKWDADHRPDQLALYDEIARRLGAKLMFIAPAKQVAEAKTAPTPCTAICWSDVHASFIKQADPALRDFVDFLMLEGLGQEAPLSALKLAAYVAGRAVEGDCLRLARKLGPRCRWDFLPKRFRHEPAYPKLRWGRIGIELGDWSPALFLGFLLDGEDHKLELVSPGTSIDLMLALDYGDPSVVVDANVLGARAKALKALGVHVLAGEELASKWRKLVVREPLAATIRGCTTEDAQLEAIHSRLETWCATLFDGGQLEAALTRTKARQ